MTSEEHAKKFLEMFPEPQSIKHHPKKFDYYVRLYLHNIRHQVNEEKK